VHGLHSGGDEGIATSQHTVLVLGALSGVADIQVVRIVQTPLAVGVVAVGARHTAHAIILIHVLIHRSGASILVLGSTQADGWI